MIDKLLNKSMKQIDIKRWPRLVLRTADAYADRINSKKNNSTKGFNTVIYGNFL